MTAIRKRICSYYSRQSRCQRTHHMWTSWHSETCSIVVKARIRSSAVRVLQSPQIIVYERKKCTGRSKWVVLNLYWFKERWYTSVYSENRYPICLRSCTIQIAVYNYKAFFTKEIINAKCGGGVWPSFCLWPYVNAQSAGRFLSISTWEISTKRLSSNSEFQAIMIRGSLVYEYIRPWAIMELFRYLKNRLRYC